MDSSPSRFAALAVALTAPGCALFAHDAQPTNRAPTAELVEANPDIAARDLFYGVGGAARAPDPFVTRLQARVREGLALADGGRS